jgi:hypothetical protein
LQLAIESIASSTVVSCTHVICSSAGQPIMCLAAGRAAAVPITPPVRACPVLLAL